MLHRATYLWFHRYVRLLKRIAYLLVAGIIACVLGMTAQNAQAANGDQITRFDIQVALDTTGRASVTQTMDVQYATSGHGPYLWFLTRQQYDNTHDRLYTYSGFQVTSPTGAPTETDTTTGSNYIQIRVGDANQTVRGTQTYVVTYTVTGLVNSNVQQDNGGKMDEFYWNAIGPGWDLPISNVSVEVTSPTDVSQTICWTGADFKTPCSGHAQSGPLASYTQDSLQPDVGLAIDAGWPVGTFPGVTLDLVASTDNPFTVSGSGTVTTAGAGILTVLAGWLLVRIRRKGSDEQYANVTPGMLPARGDKVEIKYEEVRDAAVAFEPPRGIPPRLVGAVVREGSADVDITASIIDLAVRGYVQMNQQEGDDFTFTRTNLDPGSLNPVDRQIYNGMFATGPTLTKAAMSSQGFYETYSGFQTTLRREFAAQNWYKTANPTSLVMGYRVGGFLIAAAGTAGFIYLGTVLGRAGLFGVGWLAVPCLILGLGMIVLAKRMPARTPLGSAVAVQSFGFKKYLETAEADQIRWEEGQDIFSRYLPYAISFGCADHWAKIFEELAAKGAPVPQPTWYVGYGPYGYVPVWGRITGSIGNVGSSFTQAVVANAAAQARATGGSSGGSGFSGGGFGGGAGGGGGGTW